MKLNWMSNAPWLNSGYGKITALFVPRIASLGHEITISSPYSHSGNILEWQGFPVLPCARDSAGNDTIVPSHEYFSADWTVLLADPFSLLKGVKQLSQIPLAFWFPVDCCPVGDGDIAVLRESQGVPVAMSRFGEKMLQDEGAEPLYCPLAVDTGLYSPGDPHGYRDTVPAIDDETFVIGIVGMNRDILRKGFAEQLLAFARFHARHPDTFLSLHTSPVSNPGLNIKGMATRLGICDAVGFPDSYSYDLGIITEEQMVSWYRGLDVLSFCSYGEGFGLPLIEAQSCGIPVITTDGSSTSELCGAGYLVTGTPFWSNGHTAWWKRPDADDIEQAYESAYQSWRGEVLPVKQARDFAMLYDVDKVFDRFFVPVLDELEDRGAA
jgi:glycosyltransferase involved in cell wall biosynthesis